MKELKIKEGKHVSNQLPRIVSTEECVAEIIFNDSCAYLLEGEDQKDWNKMPVGFSIGLLPHGLTKPMHYNSARFGWRYEPHHNKIQVAPYCYNKGVRIYPEVSDFKWVNLDLNTKYKFLITKFSNGYNFNVINESGAPIYGIFIELPTSKFGWSSCLFFGGNQPAPQTITMQYEKIA